VIVVGAGPAGAARSLLLAQRGVAVTLLERRRCRSLDRGAAAVHAPGIGGSIMRFIYVLAFAPLLVASPTRAEGVDVVVGVPVRDGVAGKPQPGVLLTPEQKKRQALPAQILVEEGSAAGGTTTVRPEFGGGYSVENSATGSKTVVKPNFGGGYRVEQNGRTTTEVKPNFGGGYRVESTKDSPTLILPPPPQR
jgi:hypothetical protein